MDSNNSFFFSSEFCIPNFYILLTWYIDPLIKWLNHKSNFFGFSHPRHSAKLILRIYIFFPHRRFVLLVYCFLQYTYTYEQVSREICLTSGDEDDEDDDGRGLSSRTISKFYAHFTAVIGLLQTIITKVVKITYRRLYSCHYTIRFWPHRRSGPHCRDREAFFNIFKIILRPQPIG